VAFFRVIEDSDDDDAPVEEKAATSHGHNIADWDVRCEHFLLVSWPALNFCLSLWRRTCHTPLKQSSITAAPPTSCATCRKWHVRLLISISFLNNFKSFLSKLKQCIEIKNFGAKRKIRSSLYLRIAGPIMTMKLRCPRIAVCYIFHFQRFLYPFVQLCNVKTSVPL